MSRARKKQRDNRFKRKQSSRTATRRKFLRRKGQLTNILLDDVIRRASERIRTDDRHFLAVHTKKDAVNF